jgi:hypothetical protein
MLTSPTRPPDAVSNKSSSASTRGRWAAQPTPLQTARRALKLVAFGAVCALVAGILASRTLIAAGAITLAVASALLVLTRIERAHEGVVRRTNGAASIEPSSAWRAGARAAIRIGLAIALISITVFAVADGEVVASAAVAAVTCAISIFGGATWLAAVGEEEESVRREVPRPRASQP